MFFAFLYSVFVCFYGLVFMFFMFFGFVGFAFYCTFVCVCVYVCLYLYCGVSQMVTTPSFAVFCAVVCVCACVCVCVCVCVFVFAFGLSRRAQTPSVQQWSRSFSSC